MNNHNLTPFSPGESGNPSGRPKKLPVTDVLREQMRKPIPAAMMAVMKPALRAVFTEIYGNTPTFADMMAFKLVQSSGKGDIFAMKELLDRVEGKVAQKSVLENGEGGPLKFVLERIGNAKD